MEHKQLIVRSKVEKPPKDEQAAVVWVCELVDILKGNLLEVRSIKTNQGYSVFALMEMSHVSLHVWGSDPSLIQLDAYICSEMAPTDLFDHFEQFSILTKSFMYIDRENTIQRIT